MDPKRGSCCSKSNVYVSTHTSAHHSLGLVGSEVPPGEEAVATVWGVHF